ncbi:hypothetical protein O3Q52_17315 [Streptomyces sp. ActVer]|uniref:hypothetical protein n=1 Tax=Streptomyces sp. ActVer TaxID=3014558 RepID=UPI0022B3F310|nr:hypothetical protein [Streptomyces sp. ActVer]MCZ4509924.1 hypothetical protein [Streptomyces sp. ActVer]
MTFPLKPFQSPPPRIERADVPLSTLQADLRDLVARQNEQRAADPAVGLNPTGRPRRSSAPSRRKQARRTTTVEETS